MTLRDETEWVELKHAGWIRLVPSVCADAVEEAIVVALGQCGANVQPYKAGDASQWIVERLVEGLGL